MDKNLSNFITKIVYLINREYNYWLAEYSPIIPQKSITTTEEGLSENWTSIIWELILTRYQQYW